MSIVKTRTKNHISPSERVYGLMLYLYPKPYRKKYGDEMAQVFRDLHNDTLMSTSHIPVLSLWLFTLQDIVISVVKEHVSYRPSRDRILIAFTGFLMILPALLFLGVVLLKGLGFPSLFTAFDTYISSSERRMNAFRTLSPLLFLGAPFFAFFANFFLFFRMNLRVEQSTFISSFRFKGNALNMVLSLISMSILAIITMYLISENLPCFTGHSIKC